MRTSTIVMIAFAVVFGLLAVFVAQSWLNSQAEHAHAQPRSATRSRSRRSTIVVASEAAALRQRAHGRDRCAKSRGRTGRCRPAPSPRSPTCCRGGKRVVLTADRDRTSRCCASKITGPGQRATLSAMVRDGMKAVTIRVNDVDGVARLRAAGRSRRRRADAPGRQDHRPPPTSCCRTSRVLAIDQIADERTDKPSVAKAVTLEVDAVGAQKLSLSPPRSARCR